MEKGSRSWREAKFPLSFAMARHTGRNWALGSSNETIGRITLLIAFSFFSV
jgi:hypothetical protein